MKEIILEKFIQTYGADTDKINVVAEEDPGTYTLNLSINNLNFTLTNVDEEVLVKFGISKQF